MPKAETIEINSWVDSCGDHHAYAKGHHPDAEFMTAAAHEMGCDMDDVESVQRGWMRSVPAQHTAEEFDTRFVSARKGECGAWPITIEGWFETLEQPHAE